MRFVIAGGHGKIALIIQRLLTDELHDAVGIIRNPDHVDEVEASGASALVLDLERTSVTTLASHLEGADGVVFAAGAGPGSGAERKLTVDRDGAILLADAAELAGVRRMIVISAINADRFDPHSDDVFQVYLRAKSEADANIRERDLEWTIVRPGSLTDEPATGMVMVADDVPNGSIPRADVAALVVSLLTTREGIHRQLEVVARDTPNIEVRL